MYEVVISASALRELGQLRAYDGRQILDTIEKHLTATPLRKTRNQKLLQELEPSFEAEAPVWQLRVGNWRVFYDVEEAERVVHVRAVRRKPPHRTTKEIV